MRFEAFEKGWKDSRWPEWNPLLPNWLYQGVGPIVVYWPLGLTSRHYPCSGGKSGHFKSIIWTDYSRRIRNLTILRCLFQRDQEKPQLRSWTTAQRGWRGITHQAGKILNSYRRITQSKYTSTSYERQTFPVSSPGRKETTIIHQEVLSLPSVSLEMLWNCSKVF